MSKLENYASGRLDLEAIPDNATDEGKALFFGERLGCPIVPTLIKERGAETMARRYAEILFYYGYILDTVARKSSAIAEEISQGIIRNESEKLFEYDEAWVPNWNKMKIPGTETPWGYALPRLLVSYVADKHNFSESKQNIWVRALKVLDETVENLEESDTANEFLVKFAELLVNSGADPNIILAKTISAGRLKQETLHQRFKKIIESLSLHAPTLWSVYESLSSQEKEKLGIAEP